MSTLTEMKIKKECGVCPTPIWQVVGVKLKKSPEYREVTIELDDGSLMRVGVCSNHTTLDDKTLQSAMTKVKQGWMEEVAFGVGNEAWVKSKGLKLKAIGVL